MAEHMMVSMNPGRFPDAANGLQNYRMGINSLQSTQHAQAGLRRDHPGVPLLHYGGASIDSNGGMRPRPGVGNLAGQMTHHQMPTNVMYSTQQQQQQQQQQQHQQQQQQQQQFLGTLSPQQLMATMHLQKLNNQYHGHPLIGMNNGMVATGQQYRNTMNQTPLPGIQHVAPSSLSLNVMDTDLIDEDVLTSLVLELGLDRIQELPELWLGQNEFDFISDFVHKQQPSTVSC
ncbi:cbp/p300-interacting transactivator 4b [Carcharodon carcharias]|uniref:cbp/p300-interacting transactivator 4b n=1 Tax=Carcharodon carcharias TaxID=13397 RepID=UPI001B7DC498|nr:cbp/p300-interacting transactivator 4b [Carcharodon carcharias]